MERPTKVEAGQRWMSPGGREFTILHGDGGPAITAGATFLGWRDGYGPKPPEFACAAGCACHATKAPLTGWGCGKHNSSGTNPAGCPTCELEGLYATKAPPDPGASVIEGRAEFHRTEMNCGDARVGNLTALESIRSRKPPEPWRPSVDEWDLLPDAGR